MATSRQLVDRDHHVEAFVNADDFAGQGFQILSFLALGPVKRIPVQKRGSGSGVAPWPSRNSRGGSSGGRGMSTPAAETVEAKRAPELGGVGV